ncbi:hypothetical protein AB4Z13_16130 [Rhizobium sp. YAF28]|uniref:hypothetical protein n=1 Tax=Rhizobium sp. YAF28 TaxID=3233081 RepID=UPI003F972BC8
MADVNIIPRISCDNCGLTVDKQAEFPSANKKFQKPRDWGSLKIEGSRSTDSYGGKDRLDFTDLCPKCATAALEAAATVLKTTRGEE